ncbi:MAG: transglycosylase SLT domain-containing protein [Saprospiraceae bacterium]|nr:transglycosylase SLT domain-containing protein [Saprospiraceae bacterium]
MLSRTARFEVRYPMIKVPVLSLTVYILFLSLLSSPISALANLDVASFEAFDGFLAPTDQDKVSYYIEQFLAHPETTKELLERSAIYFPTIEKELYKQGLPEELKVLPLIESRCNPQAISYVGAAGLWQFMVPTARQMGLTINSQIDERCDPQKATEAALAYLQYLHQKYEDWSLVFAAYNAGPTRVNRAIKQAGGDRCFEAIKAFLPKQTREYIPKYLAAQYVIEHHRQYGIQPDALDLDMQMTSTIRLLDKMSLSTISKITGIEKEKVALLNPSLRKSYVPKVSDGFDLVLPARVAQSLHLHILGQPQRTIGLRYHTIELLIEQEISLSAIGEELEIDPYLLKSWNQLTGKLIPTGTILTIHEIYSPINNWIRTYTPLRSTVITLDPIPSQRHQMKKEGVRSIPQTNALAWQETFNWDLHKMSLVDL